MKRFFLGFMVFVLLCLLSLSIGAKYFSWSLLLQGNSEMTQLFFESRLPRLVSVLLAGSSMSVAGLLMQTITQNEFAAPSTVGTVQASQLGLVISLFLFSSPSLFQKMVCAFIAAMIMTAIFVVLQRQLQLKEKWMVPLIGLMLGGIVSSFTQMVAYEWNLVHSLSSWLQGSFSMVQTHQYEWLFLNGIILMVAFLLAQHYAIASLGEVMSSNLGLSYQLLETITLVLVALTTSVTIITVGSLPFIGVIVPNMIRIYQGGHVKQLVPSTAIVGSIMVLIADIFSRLVIPPYEVSVSLILGTFGAACFMIQVIFLSTSRRRKIR